MQTLEIYLESMERIREFENEIGKSDCKFEIVSGGFVADAKSIMALFALDLAEKHELRISGEDREMVKKTADSLHRFTKPAIA